MEEEFIQFCIQGDLEQAKAQLERRISVDMNICADSAFHFACRNGHLEVAQWLFTLKPDIDIEMLHSWAFREACEKGYLEVARWLQSLRPDLYTINCDNNTILINRNTFNYPPLVMKMNYNIREKEEKIKMEKKEMNWQKRKYLVWLASCNCPEQNKHNLLYKLPSDVSRMLIGFV
jgi:hypothetical protein